MIIPIGVAFAVGLVGWVYQALKPPLPKICGSANGPPVTSPRVKLNDGRHLAYRELGVPKEEAQYKIIVCHGYNNYNEMYLPVSQELIEDLKLHIVLYDRAGYGESDPYPARSMKTEAFDIEELADKLQLGTKFCVIGCSLGAYFIWSCLKYFPHRLLGASLVVPTVNYWWRSLPSAISIQSFKKISRSYKYTLRLFYWWAKQKWFPTLEKIKQQGAYESLHRDFLVTYGKWEFDPIDLNNPFPDNKGSVHMCHGSADRVACVEFNHFITEKLPWIQYPEIPNAGHLIS